MLLSTALWDAVERSRKSNSKFIRWQTDWLLGISAILRIGIDGAQQQKLSSWSNAGTLKLLFHSLTGDSTSYIMNALSFPHLFQL